ncbi:hypothetical protein [Candidatus Phytoplasma mali]|nr:hypothetical protein [Candidatus Phytoplasma mali]
MIGIFDLFNMYFNFHHYFTWLCIGLILITIYTFVSKFIFGKFSIKSFIFIIIIIFLILFLIKTIFFNPYAKNSEYCNKLITKTDEVLKKVDECIKEKTELGVELLNSLNIYQEMIKDLNDIKGLNIQQQNEIKTKIKVIDEAIIKIKADIESRKQTIIKLETEKGSKIKTKNEIETKIKDLEERLKTETDPDIRAKLKTEIAELQNQQTTLVQELINLDVEIKKLNNEINYLNKNLENLNLVKTDLEQNFKRLMNEDTQISYQIDSIEKRKERIQVEINENEKQLQELKDKKRNYEISKKNLEELLVLGKTYEMENAWNAKNIHQSITNVGNIACKCIAVNQGMKLAGKFLDLCSSFKTVPQITNIPLNTASANSILEQKIKSAKNGEFPMIDKPTFERLLQSLEDDMANIDNEIISTQNHRQELQKRISSEVNIEHGKILQKIQALNSINNDTREFYNERFREKISKYDKIEKEFNDDKFTFQGKADSIIDLYNKKTPLNEDLKLAISTRLEELKLKNPSLFRAQTRYLKSKGFDIGANSK